jgi:hypothetical protein
LNKTGFGIICFGLVVVLIAANLLSNSLSDGLCQNKVLREVPSPNGQLKAVLFSRTCGSEDGVQLSVLSASDSLPNKNGNVLPNDEKNVRVNWQGDTTLAVQYENGPKTYIKDDSMWVARLPWPTQVALKLSR